MLHKEGFIKLKTTLYDTIKYNAIQYSAIQKNTIQSNAIQSQSSISPLLLCAIRSQIASLISPIRRKLKSEM